MKQKGGSVPNLQISPYAHSKYVGTCLPRRNLQLTRGKRQPCSPRFAVVQARYTFVIMISLYDLLGLYLFVYFLIFEEPIIETKKMVVQFSINYFMVIWIE